MTYRIRWLAILLGVLIALGVTTSTTSAQMTDSRARKRLAAGSPVLISRPSPSAVADVEIDTVNRRLFVGYYFLDVVDVYQFDGTLLASVSAPGIDTMTQTPDAVFVLLKSSGSILRIDRTTLAARTFASGFVEPIGMTSNNGFLYISGRNATNLQSLYRVNATTGVASPIPAYDSMPFSFSSFLDPTPPGNFLYPDGNRRIDLADSPPSMQALLFPTSCKSILDDGELILGSGTAIAVNPTIMTSSNRRWSSASGSVVGCSAGGGIVALTVSKLVSFDIEVFDQTNPGMLIRRFSAGADAGAVHVANDGSVIVAAGRRNASASELYILPGVDNTGFPLTASTPVAPRKVAPLSGAYTLTSGRLSATTVSGIAPLTAMDDWAIDPATGRTFIGNSRAGVVEIFDSTGNRIGAISELAQPSSIVACNGKVFVALFGSGKIIEIGALTFRTSVTVGNVPTVNQLMCASGVLYAAGSGQNVPGLIATRGVVWRIDSGGPTLIDLPHGCFAKTGTNGDLVSYPYGFFNQSYLRVSPTTPSARTSSPSVDLGYRGPEKPLLQFSADGLKFVDNFGTHFNSTTMQPTGVTTPGGSARISQATPEYIATNLTSSTIKIYNGLTPEISIDPSLQFVDMDFAPSSNDLVIIVRRLSDSRLFVTRATNL
jgi:hypothetical protein